jgi:hypothetical protein
MMGGEPEGMLGRDGKMAQAREMLKDLTSTYLQTLSAFVICIYYECNYFLTYIAMLSTTLCIIVHLCVRRDHMKTGEGKKSRPVM